MFSPNEERTQTSQPEEHLYKYHHNSLFSYALKLELKLVAVDMTTSPNQVLDPPCSKEVFYEHDSANTPKTALDWDGENDPECPLNWSRGKRYYHLCVASFLSFAASVRRYL